MRHAKKARSGSRQSTGMLPHRRANEAVELCATSYVIQARILSFSGGWPARRESTQPDARGSATAFAGASPLRKRQPQERQHSAASWRDAGPTAVVRPVNKAPGRRTVTPACNDGGARERVPPASSTLCAFCARDRSRKAEALRGSVHESPVRIWRCATSALKLLTTKSLLGSSFARRRF
jgi:hypothetical protein